MEIDLLGLEPPQLVRSFLPVPGTSTTERDLDIEIQDQRQVRLQQAERARHFIDQFEAQPPRMPLVSERRIEVSITEDHRASAECGFYDLIKMLDPVRHVEQKLGNRRP